ncbi:hypothetical protein E4U52_005219 [Claviceps spartinae]|nr:hypothetical protein E4U52_005219 [Claviceps spartinae]
MAACSGAFKESEGTYRIKDFTLTHVKCMADFLYAGTYSTPKALPSTSTTATTSAAAITLDNRRDIDDPVLHAVMYAVGDKYLIEDLKNCAKSFYQSSLYHHATTVEAFLQSVREIYTRTTDEQQHSRELRRIAVKAGLRKFGLAMVSNECKSLCDEVLEECPAFGSDILRPLMRKMEDDRMGRRCSYCGISHPPEDYLAPIQSSFSMGLLEHECV